MSDHKPTPQELEADIARQREAIAATVETDSASVSAHAGWSIVACGPVSGGALSVTARPIRFGRGPTS